MKIFIDTDLAIAFLSRKDGLKETKAKEVMKQLFIENDEIYLTILNYAEILRGAYISSKVAQNIQTVEEFARRFDIIQFDDRAVQKYAKVYADLKQRGESIGDIDEMIASVVMANEGVLYTHNVEHFDRITLLSIVDWFE